MADHAITRRQFVRDGSLAATALAAGLSWHPDHPRRRSRYERGRQEDPSATAPDMEYRRCGRTNFMASAVALGGHWKRIDKVLGHRAQGRLDGQRTRSPGFDQNRRDMVTRCLERGINWVDACCIQEMSKRTSKALKGRREADVHCLPRGSRKKFAGRSTARWPRNSRRRWTGA